VLLSVLCACKQNRVKRKHADPARNIYSGWCGDFLATIHKSMVLYSRILVSFRHLFETVQNKTNQSKLAGNEILLPMTINELCPVKLHHIVLFVNVLYLLKCSQTLFVQIKRSILAAAAKIQYTKHFMKFVNKMSKFAIQCTQGVFCYALKFKKSISECFSFEFQAVILFFVHKISSRSLKQKFEVL